MKISELIEELKKIEELNGDLRVMAVDREGYGFEPDATLMLAGHHCGVATSQFQDKKELVVRIS